MTMPLRTLRAAAVVPALLGLLSLLGCAEPEQAEPAEPGADAVALDTEDQNTLYALGQAMAQNVAPFNLDEAELAVVQRGFGDGVLGREPEVSLQDYGPKIQELARSRAAAAASGESQAASQFVEQAAAEPGAVRTGSGLVFTEIVAGSGSSPDPTDQVRVHYHGTLRDGRVFDSSVDRGTPATFPLNRVIPCWTEALQRMKEGGKAKVVCPPDIAYGQQGRPPQIPPGAALVFEVELLEVLGG